MVSQHFWVQKSKAKRSRLTIRSQSYPLLSNLQIPYKNVSMQ